MALGLKRETPFVNLFAINGGKATFDVESMTRGWSRRNTGWTVPEAYLGLIVMTALSDGHYHEEEQKEVLKLGRRSPVLNQLSMTDLSALNDAVNEKFKTRPDGLREACETLPVEMRLSVFGHCVEVALADGVMQKSEAQFLGTLVELLNIDTEKASTIVQVLLTTSEY